MTRNPVGAGTGVVRFSSAGGGVIGERGVGSGDLLFGATATGVVRSVYSGSVAGVLPFTGVGYGTLPDQVYGEPDMVIYAGSFERAVTVRS